MYLAEVSPIQNSFTPKLSGDEMWLDSMFVAKVMVDLPVRLESVSIFLLAQSSVEVVVLQLEWTNPCCKLVEVSRSHSGQCRGNILYTFLTNA
jgi:hypothetical protein